MLSWTNGTSLNFLGKRNRKFEFFVLRLFGEKSWVGLEPLLSYYSFGVGDHFGSCLGRFWGSFEVGDYLGSGIISGRVQVLSSFIGSGCVRQLPKFVLWGFVSANCPT